MKLEEHEIKCVCGKWAQPKLFNVEGIRVKGWECDKCKRIEYSDEINKVLMIRKLQRQPLVVKIGVLGASMIVRLPKQIEELVALKKGEQVNIYPESSTKITIAIKK